VTPGGEHVPSYASTSGWQMEGAGQGPRQCTVVRGLLRNVPGLARFRLKQCTSGPGTRWCAIPAGCPLPAFFASLSWLDYNFEPTPPLLVVTLSAGWDRMVAVVLPVPLGRQLLG
jgi:hypothetical protein